MVSFFVCTLIEALGWGAKTYEILKDLSAKPGTGIDMVQTFEYFREPQEDPSWIATVENFEKITDGLPGNYVECFSFVTSIIEMPVYLRWIYHEYEKLGLKFKDISLANIKYSVPTYYVVAPAECSSNLARYDGVRFGHRSTNSDDLDSFYKQNRKEGFGQEVKRRIITGTYVLSAGYYDAYYLKAQKVRQLINQDFLNAFKEVDVIMGPTTQQSAFKLGEKVDDPVSMYMNDIYTISSNLSGVPAISHPVGFVDNLPFGLQIIAPHFKEQDLLNITHRYQMETDWHLQIPEICRGID